MFERFTEMSRQVVVGAHQEANDQRQDYIGTEHLLLGLLRQPDGLGAIALSGMGLSLETARESIVRIAPPGNKRMGGLALPFTPHAQHALELAHTEAQALGHNYVGTEHELLGLIRDARPSDEPRWSMVNRDETLEGRLFPDDEQSIVGEILASFEIDPDEVCDVVKRILEQEPDLLAKMRLQAKLAET